MTLAAVAALPAGRGFRAPTLPLPAIVALARAGAVTRAQALFEAGGYATPPEQPGALAVKGRLLKARALSASGPERLRLLNEAAAAYRMADRLAPAPYLAINVATLAALAGDRAGSAALADAVLARFAAPGPPVDTPYFVAATRAEALVIKGDVAGASAAMAEAIAADPDGWDDRAATISQFAALCAALDLPVDWLDPLRPPAALHFAGHIGFAASSANASELAARTADLVAAQRIGFAYGALAAGADLIIAEALLAAGVELHAVLPCPADRFAAQSVAPAGEAWVARYDAVLDACTSVTATAGSDGPVHDPLATRLAADVAMGRAVLCADRYVSHAHQVVVFDLAGGGANTAALARRWPTDATQHVWQFAREVDPARLFPPEQPDPARHDAAHVALVSEPHPALAGVLAAAIAGRHPLAVRPELEQWLVTFAEADEAVAFAAAVIAEARAADVPLPSLALTRGLVRIETDPLAGTMQATGLSLDQATRLVRLAAPGVVLATETFADGLALLTSDARWRCQFYLDAEPGIDEAAYLVEIDAQ